MSAKSNKKSDYEVDHNVFILIFAAQIERRLLQHSDKQRTGKNFKTVLL